MRRSDRLNPFLRWWWSIDSVMLTLVLVLMLVGAFLTATASPAVAMRIGVSSVHFLYKQLIFLSISAVLVILISLFSTKAMKRFVFIGFLGTITLMVLVLFVGYETKGAKRWMNLLSFSLQPSEFIKSFYAVITAFILASVYEQKQLFSLRAWNIYVCCGLHVFICILLLLQPDFGMAMTISVVTVGQFFIAGLPILWVVLLIMIFISSIFMAYYMLPHVQYRIDSFIKSEDAMSYQASKSVESYASGGVLGRGPGEGVVKLSLPDAHTDFIFAVAAEEMGAIFCIFIIIILVAITVKAIVRIADMRDIFVIYAVSGLMLYFCIQSIFNIGVTLHLFPTKGMTLPFISYGGSSTFSFAIAMGLYLNLTKRQSVLYSHSIR